MVWYSYCSVYALLIEAYHMSGKFSGYHSTYVMNSYDRLWYKDLEHIRLMFEVIQTYVQISTLIKSLHIVKKDGTWIKLHQNNQLQSFVTW